MGSMHATSVNDFTQWLNYENIGIRTAVSHFCKAKITSEIKVEKIMEEINQNIGTDYTKYNWKQII